MTKINKHNVFFLSANNEPSSLPPYSRRLTFLFAPLCFARAACSPLRSTLVGFFASSGAAFN